MAFLTTIQNFVKNLDEQELIKYFIGFGLTLLSIITLILYFNIISVNKYKTRLSEINKERLKTKRILTDFKLVNLQKQKIEDILSAHKNFFIAQEYNNILKKLGLTNYQSEEPTKSDGQLISGKIERILTFHLDNITMKQLTDLLTYIAEIERLYPKELIIKKVPNSQKIDTDVTIATLEDATENE